MEHMHLKKKGETGRGKKRILTGAQGLLQIQERQRCKQDHNVLLYGGMSRLIPPQVSTNSWCLKSPSGQEN